MRYLALVHNDVDVQPAVRVVRDAGGKSAAWVSSREGVSFEGDEGTRAAVARLSAVKSVEEVQHGPL